MKRYTYLLLAILSIELIATGCKKQKVEPIDQLPPATQEGKNTFGCLVNGEAWTPKGNNGTSNLYISYDPSSGNGDFLLATYKILSDTDREYMSIYTYNIKTQRDFIFNAPFTDLYYSNARCDLDGDKDVYRKGKLTITKFDLPNRIIAGIFEVVLAKPGCDTIKITNGRFDMKFGQ
jgi:hypothetical protein